MKTLVLGLGNPILCDDGVGIRVAHEVANRLNDPQVTVAESSAAGLSLLDSIAGYDKVIVIDAIQTEKGQAGQIYRMKPGDLSFTRHLSSAHQINLITALELGKMLNLAMPEEITVFAIEAEDVATFSEECTPQVAKAIPQVVKMVVEDLVG